MAIVEKPPGLLTIPRELRNQIYSYLGVSTEKPDWDGALVVTLHHSHDINVILTCKRIKNEILEVEPAISTAQFYWLPGHLQDALPFTARNRACTCPGSSELLQLLHRARRCTVRIALWPLMSCVSGLRKLHGGGKIELKGSDEECTNVLVEKLRDIIEFAAEVFQDARQLEINLDMGHFHCVSSLGGLQDFRIGKTGVFKLRPEILAQLAAEDLLPATELEIVFRFTTPKSQYYIPPANIADETEVIVIPDGGVSRSISPPSVTRLERCMRPVMAGQTSDTGFPGLQLTFVREYEEFDDVSLWSH